MQTDLNAINIKNSNKSHTKVINEIAEGTNVLDVGCAGGHVGEYLCKEKRCTVVGLDYKAEFINLAAETKAYNALYQIDLNTLNDELAEYESYFDYIIAADVIEHLYSPDETVKKLQHLLKEDGYMILSIPNIAHGSIKLSLLSNKFDYTSEGLLDSSHIRFFTLKSIVEFMTRQNLEIISLDSVIYFINHTEQQVQLNKYPYDVIKFVENNPESYVYQYVLKVKKSYINNSDLQDINKTMAENEIKKVNKQVKQIRIKQIITLPERFIRKKIIHKLRKQQRNG